MTGIRLNAAILHYNENRNSNQPRLKRIDIGNLWFPELEESTKNNYVSLIAKGSKQQFVTPDRVRSLCELTGVDANFLYNIKPMKK